MSPNRDFSPLYHKIKQHLLDQIISGTLKAGDMLPSETQLLTQYNASRITIRRALKELIQQGILYTIQGKGTFVAHAPIRQISGFHSFSDDIRAKGLRASSQVLLFNQIPADHEIAARLHINHGDSVYQVQRVRFANDQPVAFETAYLPATLYPNLEQFDLRNSLYEIFRTHYHIFPAWADAEIQATTTSPEIAQTLKMQTGEPVLEAHRLTYTESFELVEYVVSIYCGNRFTFFTGRQSIL
jgi:GntR family transcriptional regulator